MKTNMKTIENLLLSIHEDLLKDGMNEVVFGLMLVTKDSEVAKTGVSFSVITPMERGGEVVDATIEGTIAFKDFLGDEPLSEAIAQEIKIAIWKDQGESMSFYSPLEFVTFLRTLPDTTAMCEEPPFMTLVRDFLEAYEYDVPDKDVWRYIGFLKFHREDIHTALTNAEDYLNLGELLEAHDYFKITDKENTPVRH